MLSLSMSLSLRIALTSRRPGIRATVKACWRLSRVPIDSVWRLFSHDDGNIVSAPFPEWLGGSYDHLGGKLVENWYHFCVPEQGGSVMQDKDGEAYIHDSTFVRIE